MLQCQCFQLSLWSPSATSKTTLPEHSSSLSFLRYFEKKCASVDWLSECGVFIKGLDGRKLQKLDELCDDVITGSVDFHTATQRLDAIVNLSGRVKP